MIKAFQVQSVAGKCTHTPISNASPVLCKEAQNLAGFPKVYYVDIMSWLVIGMLGGGGKHCLCLSQRRNFSYKATLSTFHSDLPENAM